MPNKANGNLSSKRLQLAQLRALSFSKARAFFAERGVLEVDTPILSQGVSLDAHIGFFESHFHPAGYPTRAASQSGYLQTSPEPHLKRLLCEGFPDLYQIAKCFRNGEAGPKHNPEFTMVEWYRLNWDMDGLQKETLEFCQHLAGVRPVVEMTWEDAWRHYLGFSPFEADEELLRNHPCILDAGIPPSDLPTLPDVWDFLMAHSIEPRFDPQVYTVLRHFPIQQAAQSQMHPQTPHLALRFEIYSGGLELGNGYQELLSPAIYRQRFTEELEKRGQLHRPCPAMDERLLRAFENGLPSCSGVAVGFDRFMQIANDSPSVSGVLLFPWGEH